MKSKKLFLTLLSLLTSSVFAAPSEELLERAREGDAISQFSLAREYCRDGDYNQAIEWFEKSAKQGIEVVQLYLANIYHRGNCNLEVETQQVEPNYDKALEWYKTVAFKDKPEDLFLKYFAQFKMAEIYKIKGDDDQVKRLDTELAHIPDSVIQNNEKGPSIQIFRGGGRYGLALLYSLEEPFSEENVVLAYQWAKKAVKDGNSRAIALLALLEYQGLGTKKNVASAVERMRGLCESKEDLEMRQTHCNTFKEMKQGTYLQSNR